MSYDLIILRLHPVDPTDGPSFTSYLTDLSITVYDRSFADPKGKTTVLGTAVYDPDPSKSTILQHHVLVPPPPGPAPVATAMAVMNVPPGYHEYVNPDLRLSVKRGTRTLVDQRLDYNVDVARGVPLPPQNPGAYAGLAPVAAYVALPDPGVGLDPSRAYVSLPADGSPPNFDDLKAAVLKVLAQDPGGAPDVTALTPAQCRHIAYEIAYNRDLDPLPAPLRSLEEMYTAPVDDDAEADRKKFEADLLTYYSLHNGQAETLSKYVFALSAALRCEKMSDDAAHAGFAFPVLPGVAASAGKIAESSVVLSK